MVPKEYNEQLHHFLEKIMGTPASEVKFYLYLLLVSLNGKENAYTRKVLQSALKFSDCYDDFLKNKSGAQETKSDINQQLKELITAAGTHVFWVKIQQTLLNTIGTLLGFGLSFICCLIGGLSGFSRGLWHKESLWEYSWTGFATGAYLGMAIGFRIPTKLIKNPLFRQIKLAIDGLEEALDGGSASLQHYKQTAYQMLYQDYFNQDEQRLTSYLNAEDCIYEMATFGAEFLSPKLAGHIGHHGFIKIPMGDKYYGIELTLSPSDYIKSPVQLEKRVVSGQKILEMIAFHLALQKSHALTYKYIATQLKPGEKDCFTYLNIVLIGTSQKPTLLCRYHSLDSPVGKLVGFIIKGLSAYPDAIAWPLDKGE